MLNEIVCIYPDHAKYVPCLLDDLYIVRIVQIVLYTDIIFCLCYI